MTPKSRLRRTALLIGSIAASLGVALGAAGPASADLASLKAACVARDALDNDTTNGTQMPYQFCDDGVPPTGGTTPNVGAVAAVAVPQRYSGVEGLPPQRAPDPNAGADPATGKIALDVDVSLPDPQAHPRPASGYPLIVMMHGCCSGNKTSWERSTIEPSDAEGWHYNNAWFASRGFVVVNYTARGFVSSDATGRKGSTGETQIDDLRYEINDYQHLAGQLADDPDFEIDPRRVVATGGSYGGGFSWLALTDPTWTSPQGRDMGLAAIATKYGWTDLVYSLVPNGAHKRYELPPFDGTGSSQPIGFPKQSITAALYASGTTGVPPLTSPHATFPAEIGEAVACLQSGDPYETNPACTNTLGELLPEFIKFRSAYYRNNFFARLATDVRARVPVYSAGTFTDPLFPMHEHRRMAERLKASSPHYPIQEYYGDYQHFTQNKAKEWGDVCGADHHRCRFSDYPNGDLNADPQDLVRLGITTRLNRFLDHFARTPANPDPPRPKFDVTVGLQICPQTASAAFPADEPGQRFSAGSFRGLTRNMLSVAAAGLQATTSQAAPNEHAVRSDPVGNTANGYSCMIESSPGGAATAGPGVATYDSVPLPRAFHLIGSTRVLATHTLTSPTAGGLQLNARLYDLFPDGTQVLVDRGFRRIPETQASGTTRIDLNGNGWKFAPGHRIRIELAQDDDPYIRQSNQSSSLQLSNVVLKLPVRETGRRLSGAAAIAPAP